MFSFVVDQEYGVEDLHCLVGIHRGSDLANYVKITINELAEPCIVIDCARTFPPAHEQLEIRDTEGILYIYRHQADSEFIVVGWQDTMSFCPLFSFIGPFLVGDFPYSAHLIGVEVRRNGELTVCHIR